ncbi:hypothetical protein [Blastopirellula marina]|uniref:Uncharacterized protein n=1 Tax=Blastopirellula marina TaxID=124 RepID=A0A2S8GH09_9BACT|nr:hypothetical protein [Blastopirellula marina]PQO43746.1 hypothetical protein C5Y93_24240 [Blastopirellula marina]
MNAAVLCLCAAIAGADARETLPTPQALSELLTRDAEQSELVTWKIVDDGAAIESTIHREDGEKQTIISHLVIVPCPGRPNLILAGHVVPPSDDEALASYVGPTNFGALIDVDQNLVLGLRGQDSAALTLRAWEDLTPALKDLAQPFADLVTAHPERFGQEKTTDEVKRTFINPPQIQTRCIINEVIGGRGAVARRNADIIFACSVLSGHGDRNLSRRYAFGFKELLTSELAIPAKQYFAAKPTQEKAE